MKIFGHEVKGKTVAITVGIGAALALLVAMLSKKSNAATASGTADMTNGLDTVANDSALGLSAPSVTGGATSADASLVGPLLSFEAQTQQNQLLAQLQQAQVAAAQQVATLQAELSAKIASQQLTTQQNEAQITANTSRTNTAIQYGVPALFGFLGKLFGGGSGGGSAPTGGAPSFGAPGFSGGGVPDSTSYAQEPYNAIANFGAFNLL